MLRIASSSVAGAPRLRLLSAAAAMALLGLLTVLSGCPKTGGGGGGGAKGNFIQGKIMTTYDQELIPLSRAAIELVPAGADPAAKKSDEAPENPGDMLGISITGEDGAFSIDELTSSQTYQAYGLLRGWEYEISIQAPGYYLYKGRFAYDKGGQELTIELEEKSLEVMDDTGIIEIPDGIIQSGPVRRGN